jgi:hypothetical protein
MQWELGLKKGFDLKYAGCKGTGTISSEGGSFDIVRFFTASEWRPRLICDQL